MLNCQVATPLSTAIGSLYIYALARPATNIIPSFPLSVALNLCRFTLGNVQSFRGPDGVLK